MSKLYGFHYILLKKKKKWFSLHVQSLLELLLSRLLIFIFYLGIIILTNLKLIRYILCGSFQLRVAQEVQPNCKLMLPAIFQGLYVYFRLIGMAIQLGIMAAYLKPEIRQRVVLSR